MATPRINLTREINELQLQAIIERIDEIREALHTAEDIRAFIADTIVSNECRVRFIEALGAQFLATRLVNLESYRLLFDCVSPEQRHYLAVDILGLPPETAEIMLTRADDHPATEDEAAAVGAAEHKDGDPDAEEDDDEENRIFAVEHAELSAEQNAFVQAVVAWHNAEPEEQQSALPTLNETYNALMATTDDAQVQATLLAGALNELHRLLENFQPQSLCFENDTVDLDGDNPIALPALATWLNTDDNTFTLALALQSDVRAPIGFVADGDHATQQTQANALNALDQTQQRRALSQFTLENQDIIRMRVWCFQEYEQHHITGNESPLEIAERYLEAEHAPDYETILPNLSFELALNRLAGPNTTPTTVALRARNFLRRPNQLSADRWFAAAKHLSNKQPIPDEVLQSDTWQNASATERLYLAKSTESHLRTRSLQYDEEWGCFVANRFGGRPDNANYYDYLHAFLTEVQPDHRASALVYLLKNVLLHTPHRGCHITTEQLSALLALIPSARDRSYAVAQVIDTFHDDDAILETLERRIGLPEALLREYVDEYNWSHHKEDNYKLMGAIADHNATNPDAPITLSDNAIANAIPTELIVMDSTVNDALARDSIYDIHHVISPRIRMLQHSFVNLLGAIPTSQWPQVMHRYREYLFRPTAHREEGISLYPTSIAQVANWRFSNTPELSARQSWCCYNFLLLHYQRADEAMDRAAAATDRSHAARYEDNLAWHNIQGTTNPNELIRTLREQLKNLSGAGGAIAKLIRKYLKDYEAFWEVHPECLIPLLQYQLALVLQQLPITFSEGLLIATQKTETPALKSKLTALLIGTLQKFNQFPNTPVLSFAQGTAQLQAVCRTQDDTVAAPTELPTELITKRDDEDIRFQHCLSYLSGETPVADNPLAVAQAVATPLEEGDAVSTTALVALSVANTGGPGVAAPGSALAAATSATPMSAAAPPPRGKG